MVFEKVEMPFVATEFALPQLKTGEVLVKNTYSTICTSDLHTYYGRRSACTHSVLGHEVIGKITDLGDGNPKDYAGEQLSKGDLITWSVYAYDPNSENSQKGFPQKSEGLYKYGHEQITEEHQFNGGFGTHTHLRSGTAIFKLPIGLEPKIAAPINCSHATIAGAIRLAGDLRDKKVLVNGTGMLGLSACAQATYYGAKSVWAQDIQEEKLVQALDFGASQTFLIGKDPIQEASVKSGGMDVIIETSGIPEAIEQCFDLLAIGGVLVLVGSVFPQRNCHLNAEKLVRKLLTIKGLHNYIPEDLGRAIEFITANQHRFAFEKLIGTEYPLTQLDAAFEMGRSGNYFRIGVFPG